MEKICLTPKTQGTRADTEKACVQCGGLFACGAAAGSCWCMSIPLEASALEVLSRKYEDCLCQDCLQKMSEKQIGPGPIPNPVWSAYEPPGPYASR